MNNNETYKNFLLDLCCLLKERAIEAKKEKKNQFDDGVVQGYHEVLSLIKNQLISFGIDSKEVKMNDFDPDILWKS